MQRKFKTKTKVTLVHKVIKWIQLLSQSVLFALKKLWRNLPATLAGDKKVDFEHNEQTFFGVD